MRVAALVFVVAVVGCRVRTRYDGAATTECMKAATTLDAAQRASGDAGLPFSGEGSADSMCRKCCHDRGLSDVEPGYCSCGDLGLDALMK